MRRLSNFVRKYFFIAFLIYFFILLVSFLLYFVLFLIEKQNPTVIETIYSVGETIIEGFHVAFKPCRWIFPRLNDDDYYLILIHCIISLFAFVYAYLFCQLKN